MKLPRDLLSGTYTKPRLFLCETDKTKICQLEVTDLNGSFKFNSLSELNFEVARVYNDIITGETKVNPFYDKIEALRLIYLEGFGYFELQGPELISDGIKESKSCSAYSLEYTLSQKYLDDFYINTGEAGSVEVIYAESHGNNSIVPVTLYNPSNPDLSLLHLVLQKDYGGWSIGHVDLSIQTLSRQFDIDRESIYDFLINEVCEKFNCYIVFDTINNKINLYAESLTSKFIGDGKTKNFTISPPFLQIGTVSVDGYKTTRWTYNATTGTLSLEDTPESGAHIEVVDGALTEWETNVFVTFDNLSQEININYDADNIKTVLTVTYGDENDIREANLGLPYLTDLSYYCTPEWMGQDLYDAYIQYQQKCNARQTDYTNNSQEMLEIAGRIAFEEHRQSLQYAVADNVASDTVGTYYIRGGTYPDYYYTEVSLPSEYNADTTYYKLDGINLTEKSALNLYYAIEDCYLGNGVDKIRALYTSDSNPYAFMDDVYSITQLANNLEKLSSNQAKDVEVNKFLNIMWKQVGRTPLKYQYLEKFVIIQTQLIDAGYSIASNASYPSYYLITLFIKSIESKIADLDEIISGYDAKYKSIQSKNQDISNELLMTNNFTQGQLIRLNSFLREDELQIDDIFETSQDSIADSFKTKQDAMESGRIELSKLCQPQLQFSMDMANIYALPEFEPIIDQFQLGRVIRVALRQDYIKQSRLLQVNINFEDFSDFSCEFGELTSLRTQSDIHADLLSKAISAGKSVATNSSYWTRGSDVATSTDLKIQQGLLDALTQIKAIDGTQGIVIDKYGIKLQKILDNGSIDPHQVWMVNNQILFSDDGFKTSRSALGEVAVDGNTYYGLIAEMVLSGYIEGSKIVGGTIKIGEQSDGSYAFEVHEDGTVTMGGGSKIGDYTVDDIESAVGSAQESANKVQEIQGVVDNINSQKMYRVEIRCVGPQILKVKNQTATLSCHVYSWDTEITDTLDASLFNWKRYSNNTDHDEIWNNNTVHQGRKTLTISTEDITDNANFSCEVNLPDSE